MNEKKKPAKGCGAVVAVALILALVLILAALGLRSSWRSLAQRMYPQGFAESVIHWAAEYDVDVYFVWAVIKTESGFDENALSNAQARGLMQLTEETFDWIKLKIAPDTDLTFDDMYTADVNIRFGTYYLSCGLVRYGGDMKTAAAGYHSGWTTIDKLLQNPDNTQDSVRLHTFPSDAMGHYVGKVEKNYNAYAELYGEDGDFLGFLRLVFTGKRTSRPNYAYNKKLFF